MEECRHIAPPAGEDDTEGAQRVFEEFLVLYQPALINVEQYLEDIIDHMEPAFACAYEPWHRALKDLFRGVYLISKHIPLPDPDGFREALRIFKLESAIRFLSDLCVSCCLVLQRDWGQRFREHIDLLLFSLSILNRQAQEQSLTR